MKKTDQTINESIEKIKFIMGYDSLKTLTEQSPSLIPGMESAIGNTPPDVNIYYIRRLSRILKRKYDRIDRIMKEVDGKTTDGDPSINVLKSEYKNLTQKDLPITNSTSQMSKGSTGGYTPVDGTSQMSKGSTGGYTPVDGTTQPYKYGTMGSGIGQVQEKLGLTVDNKWGPKTQAKLSEVFPQYSKQFTNNDIPNITQVNKTTSPETSIDKTSTATPTITSVQRPTLSQPINTSQLNGQSRKTQPIASNVQKLKGV